MIIYSVCLSDIGNKEKLGDLIAKQEEKNKKQITIVRDIIIFLILLKKNHY